MTLNLARMSYNSNTPIYWDDDLPGLLVIDIAENVTFI